ncbi:MAG TPA: hypothetical protein VMJ12_00565 [Candidatus Acidoferrales bacterium]|nr:hypothetical protein [Candidatus Acidoferrales bacterium]
MILAVLILVSAGMYVFVKRKVQASSSFVIQGRPARHIGLALVLGGLLAVVLPTLLSAVGLVTDLVRGLILSIATIFFSLVYVGVIMMREKRRQANEGIQPTPQNKKQI